MGNSPVPELSFQKISLDNMNCCMHKSPASIWFPVSSPLPSLSYFSLQSNAFLIVDHQIVAESRTRATFSASEKRLSPARLNMTCLWKIVDHQIVAESRTRATFCKNVHECSSNFVLRKMVLRNFLQEKRPRRHRGDIEGQSRDNRGTARREALWNLFCSFLLNHL